MAPAPPKAVRSLRKDPTVRLPPHRVADTDGAGAHARFNMQEGPSEGLRSYATVAGLAYRAGPARSDDERERCRLDLYHPVGLPGFGTVVWLHAGGLVSGERYVPDAFRERGFAVAAAGYRLSPGAKAPAYIEDAAAAIVWVFRHIAEYGGSPDRIIVGGASAGAYLALLVGLDRRWLAAHGVDAGRIAGLVSLSGQAITHFTVREERGGSGMRPEVDALAPMYHVRADAPPILLVTGDRDLELLGRYEENAFFRRMLLAAGHRAVELHELPGLDHGAVEAAALPLATAFIFRRLAAS